MVEVTQLHVYNKVLGVVHKLRLQDKVGRCGGLKMSTFCQCSYHKVGINNVNAVGQVVKKAKILSTQFVNDPLCRYIAQKYGQKITCRQESKCTKLEIMNNGNRSSFPTFIFAYLILGHPEISTLISLLALMNSMILLHYGAIITIY